jgi:hypothetical protein
LNFGKKKVPAVAGAFFCVLAGVLEGGLAKPGVF